MKTRLWLVLGMTFLFFLSSCNDEKVISNNQLVRSISVTGQDFVDGDGVVGTRASYSVDGTGFHFTWTQGDTVGIYPIGGDQVAFPISSGDGSQTAQFDGGAWALRSSYSYAAYYPFNEGNYHVDATEIPVSFIGQVQNGNGSLDCLDRFDYQASVATCPDADGNVNIELKHLGCFVRFQLTMPTADTYKSITLKSSKTPFVTSGTVDLTSDKIHITPMSTSQTISIALNNTSTTAQDSILVIYAMLAPVDLSDSNVIITITGANNKEYASVLIGKSLSLGKAYTFKANLIDGAKITDDGIVIPPDNEIWYVTSDNSILRIPDITDYGDKPFDKKIISNIYSNGKGIIKFDGPVTRVNDYPFTDNSNLIDLFLPDCVKYLGFMRENELKRLYIPRDLQQIMECNLWLYPYLEEFYGNNVSDDGRCLIINEQLVAFASAGLTDYSLPKNVKTIQNGVFMHSSLKNIELPEGLINIGGDAFYDSELEYVTFPNSLQRVHPYAFRECYNLKGFYGNSDFHTNDNYCFITHGNMAYDNIPYDDSDEICLNLFVGSELTEYTIPEGITFIQEYAFQEKNKLQSISFPSTIKQMGPYSFFNCDNITYVGGSVASEDHCSVIIDGHFLKLLVRKGIKEYFVPQGVKVVYGGAFCSSFEYNCELEKIVLNDEAEELIGFASKRQGASIGNHLKTLVLSSNLKKITLYGDLDLPLLEEVYLKSLVPPSISPYGIASNHNPNLKFFVPIQSLDAYLSNPEWVAFRDYIEGYSYDDIPCDFYISTNYSANGYVSTLQTSTTSVGIDIILMGDAFSDRQITDGTYDEVMRGAMNAFFSEEPFKSFKKLFNVYSVNVVSATEGYNHSGQALGTVFDGGTHVYGNDAKVLEYARKAIPESKLDDAVIAVIMNKDAYAGTCYFYNAPDGNYGRGTAVAYIPTNSIPEYFDGLVLHEVGGHGFAKLADEYAYESNGIVTQDVVNKTKANEQYGWWKNVDFTNNIEQVKWSTFINDSRYVSENIGCYEGGLTYWSGVWRPTDNSIMRYNTGGFNAPSRYAIWYRINKLAYGVDWNGTYEDFVSYDVINRTSSATSSMRSQSRRNYVEKPLPPLAPPVVVGHSWREELSGE